MNAVRFLVALLAPVAASFAAVTISFEPRTITSAAIASDPALQTAKCFDIVYTTTDPFTFMTTGLYLQPAPGGSFFQHPLGAVQAYSPAAWAAIPSLEFDTWLTAVPGAAFIQGPSFLGPASSAAFDTQLINRIWDSRPNPTFVGTATIARITYFGDMPGGVGTNISFTSAGMIQTNFNIPEPAAIPALLSIALLRRRAAR